MATVLCMKNVKRMRVPMPGLFMAHKAGYGRAMVLRYLFVLVCMVFLSCPVQAAPDKSFFASISARSAEGSSLLDLVLTGQCEFGPAAVCKVRLQDTHIDTPLFSGAATGTMDVEFAAEKLLLRKLDLSMPDAIVRMDKDQPRTVSLRLAGSGEYVPATGELALSRLDLTTNRGLKLSGSLAYSPDAFSARLAVNLSRADQLAELFGSALSASARAKLPTGPVVLALTATGTGQSFGPLGMQLTTTATLKRSITLGRNGVKIPALTVRSTIRTDVAALLWSAKGTVRAHAPVSLGPLAMGKAMARFDLAAVATEQGTGYDLRRLTLTPEAAKAGEAGLPVSSMTLTAQARPRADGGWLVDHAQLSLPGGRVRARLDVDTAGAGNVVLRGKGLDMAKLAPLAQALSGLPVADWGSGGRLDLRSDVTLLASGLVADTRLSVHDLACMSPSVEYMAQGVAADVRLKTRLDFASGRRRVSGTLSIPAGELLFGSLYLNMTEQPLHVSCTGEQVGPLRFQNLAADLDWQGYGQVAASGELTASGPIEEWKYTADMEATDLELGRWFDTFADAAALTNMQGEHGLEGGAALDLHLVSDGSTADATGLLYIADGSFTAADDSIEVRGASLNLPFAYRLVGPYLKRSSQFVAEKSWGELHADLVRTPFVKMKNSTTRLALIPNRFFIRDPLLLSLLGGKVRLTGMRVEQPFSKDFRLRLGARLDGLDLARMSGGKFPLEGTLGGNLGTIILTRKALTVPGSITGTFFGGTVLMDHIFAENPLAAHRKFGIDVTVRELDLERISMAMDVGRVTGKMDMDMHDVVVAYGEPVRMLLRAETSGKGDFDKTISLKAVNSLSVVGTGSGLGDVGVGMFASFFEEFAYDRIGFQCTLTNDIFRVRGLVHDGEVEYLIKKPFFTGINVVNSNPKNYISFKDMLERVQRVIGEKNDGNGAKQGT